MTTPSTTGPSGEALADADRERSDASEREQVVDTPRARAWTGDTGGIAA